MFTGLCVLITLTLFRFSLDFGSLMFHHLQEIVSPKLKTMKLTLTFYPNLAKTNSKNGKDRCI